MAQGLKGQHTFSAPLPHPPRPGHGGHLHQTGPICCSRLQGKARLTWPAHLGHRWGLRHRSPTQVDPQAAQLPSPLLVEVTRQGQGQPWL